MTTPPPGLTCPVCHAAPGRRCRGLLRIPRREPHWDRLYLARQMQEYRDLPRKKPPAGPWLIAAAILCAAVGCSDNRSLPVDQGALARGIQHDAQASRSAQPTVTPTGPDVTSPLTPVANDVCRRWIVLQAEFLQRTQTGADITGWLAGPAWQQVRDDQTRLGDSTAFTQLEDALRLLLTAPSSTAAMLMEGSCAQLNP